MELGYLLIVAASAVAGVALRPVVSPALRRALLVLGRGALALGLGVLGLIVLGRGRLAGFWTGGQAALVLLVLAALLLPFALAARRGPR